MIAFNPALNILSYRSMQCAKRKKKALLMGVQTIFNSFPKFAYNLIIVLYQTEVTKWYRFIQM